MGVDRQTIGGVPTDRCRDWAEPVLRPGFNDIVQGMTNMRDSAIGGAAA
jgi:hypothetical protein